MERLQSITTPNTWVQLDFDFTGETTDVFNKLVFFLDFATFNANTFYFDDIEGPEYNNNPPPLGTLTFPVTFDDPLAEYDLVDFGGNVSQIIVDPDDADNNIVETIKTETAELWAGTTVGGALGFAEPVPFAAPDTTLMSVVVWSPEEGIPVRLKVEDAGNGGIFVETEVVTTVAAAWDTLVFDFNNPAPGTPAINFANTYNKASIFFNFGTTGADAGEQTYYWDYMDFAGAPPPKPLMELDVQDNFEDDGWGTINEWFFQDPDMFDLATTSDPDDAENTVADYNRTGNFPYTNAQFSLEHRIDLTERNKFELDVYFPSSNNYGTLTTGAAIKLQNSKKGGDAWMTQTEIIITVNDLDEWVTLLFDFSAVADSVNYDQVVVQLGGEGHSVPGQFYFDNLYLKHVPFMSLMSPNGGEEIEQNSSFIIEWDYGWWEGDIDIELIKEGEEPEPLALGIAASDSVFEWNVFPNQEPGEDYRIAITSLDDPILTDTSSAYFTIVEVEGVQSNFTADITLFPVGSGVIFTDLSSGDPDTWEWEFEGGTPATYEGQTPPEIIYNTDGVFDVTLTVFSGGDQDVTIKDDYITVGLPPMAGFEASFTEILAGQSVDFTNLSEGEENTYQWLFEGGNPSTSEEMNPTGIVYDAVGVFDVTLIAVNIFGSDTLLMEDYIEATPVGLISNNNETIRVYPNPVEDQLYITLTNDYLSDVTLFNMNGQSLLALKKQNGTININTSDFKAGIYMLAIDDGSEVILKKVIVY